MQIHNIQFRTIHLFSALISSLFAGGFVFGIVVSLIYYWDHSSFQGTLFILPAITPFISLFFSPFISIPFFPTLLILRYFNYVNYLSLAITGALIGFLFAVLIFPNEQWQPFFRATWLPYTLAGLFGGLICFYHLKKLAMFDELKNSKT